jgi:hypothetical protein
MVKISREVLDVDRIRTRPRSGFDVVHVLVEGTVQMAPPVGIRDLGQDQWQQFSSNREASRNGEAGANEEQSRSYVSFQLLPTPDLDATAPAILARLAAQLPGAALCTRRRFVECRCEA